MSITSSSVTTSATLEQFRVQFNNLVTDVDGLENGTSNFANVAVAEDGNITFEGATNDGFQTTLTVVDPTADRTVTIPDGTGTLLMTGALIDGADTSLLFGDSSSSTDARLKFGASSDIQIYHDGTNSFITNLTGTLKVATETSGVPITIGHTTSETTVADNLTVNGTTNLVGTLSLNGSAITVSATTINTAASTGLATAMAIAL
jgi:hypothetical protein